MEENESILKRSRKDLDLWRSSLKSLGENLDEDFLHSLNYHGITQDSNFVDHLQTFLKRVCNELEDLVSDNDHRLNLPRLENYDSFGHHIRKVLHHPNYLAAGNIIYASNLMSYLKEPGGLLRCLLLFFISIKLDFHKYFAPRVIGQRKAYNIDI